MILLRIRIFVGVRDAGFEPRTSAPEKFGCATNDSMSDHI